MPTKGEEGQSIVEYVLILALIALVAFTVIKRLGRQTEIGYQKAAEKVQEAVGS